jgi:ketosteroid isomerase-like protein
MKTKWINVFAVFAFLVLWTACEAPSPVVYDHSELANGYVGVWNSGDVGALEMLLTPDFVRYAPPNTPAGALVSGIDGMKVAIQETHENILDFYVRIEETISLENIAVIRWRLSGVLAGTGLPFEVPGISLTRIADGKIAEEYSYHDNLDLLLQGGMKLVQPEQE